MPTATRYRKGEARGVRREHALHPARRGVALLRCDGALANVRDIAIASRANLLRGRRFERQGVAVEGHEFDFECFAVAVHMNDHAHPRYGLVAGPLFQPPRKSGSTCKVHST